MNGVAAQAHPVDQDAEYANGQIGEGKEQPPLVEGSVDRHRHEQGPPMAPMRDSRTPRRSAVTALSDQLYWSNDHHTGPAAAPPSRSRPDRNRDE